MNIRAEHVGYTAVAKFGAPREVIHDLSFALGGGECVAVIGREGSGKTTLLNILGGLVAPTAGRVTADGVQIWPESKEARNVRLRMGYTFQFPEEQFLSPTVGEEFSSLFRLRGIPEAEWEDRRSGSLRAAGLAEQADVRRSPFSLSLGESRRLALAMAAAVRPSAAFLDEPTSGLDAAGSACARRIVESLLGRGAAVVIATHDLEFIAGAARTVVILDEGGIAAAGEAGAILGDAALLAAHGYAPPRRRPSRM